MNKFNLITFLLSLTFASSSQEAKNDKSEKKYGKSRS